MAAAYPLQLFGVVRPLPLSSGYGSAFGVISPGAGASAGDGLDYLHVRGQAVTVRGFNISIQGVGAPTNYLLVRGQPVTVAGQQITIQAATSAPSSSLFGAPFTLFGQPVTIFGN